MIYYLQHLEKMADFCEEFKQEITNLCFTDPKTKKLCSEPIDPDYCWWPRFQEYLEIAQGVVNICDMLGIAHLDENKSVMTEYILFLTIPQAINERKYFEKCLDFIKDCFKHDEKEIRDRIQLLDIEEKNRLNEALNCYIEGCNYSTVAMSVSAIEFRLFSLMMSKCPDSELEKLTLGQLITEYLNNKQKYGNVIPKKHLPLLEHCNTYRIFSVHPKKEKITRAIATSIINMTFSFLLDEDLKHKVKENKK